jgi:hypothetical protein
MHALVIYYAGLALATFVPNGINFSKYKLIGAKIIADVKLYFQEK